MLHTECAPERAIVDAGLDCPRMRLVEPGSSLRLQLEARVRTGFSAHFGACIEGFMPELVQYTHRSGSKGVIGLRCAACEALFLETYLDEAIEDCIRRISGESISRRQIVEIGQFVIDDRAAVADFFRDLVPFLRDQGFEWACFTGTSKIRRIVARLGFVTVPVAGAEPARLNAAGAVWGNYYDNEPVVVIGKVSDPQGLWYGDATVRRNRMS